MFSCSPDRRDAGGEGGGSGAEGARTLSNQFVDTAEKVDRVLSDRVACMI